jgi:hypothetical protein
MEQRRYTVPGWTAIAAAALTLPMLVLGLILDIAARKSPGIASVVLLPYLFVASAQAICGLYALGRLKTFLNERHAFHDVDSIIIVIIIAGCAMTLAALTARVALVAVGLDKAGEIYFTALLVTAGITMAILGLIFAVKLLRLESDLGGLLKPFIYTNIAASVCFATLLLAPLGLLLDAASNVLLGMIFLRSADGSVAPDFV